MRSIMCALTVAALCACGRDARLTEPRVQFSRQVSTPRYTIAVLATLGGNSQGGGINNVGWVAGYSGRADGTRHAALWHDGSLTDLGTLGGSGAGLHSNVQWPGVSNSGFVVGISHTAALDTLGETWSCAAFMPATGHMCRGFAWRAGVMTALPTLGGENGFAAGVNERGQAVGWAETPVRDPTCNAPQVLQFRATLWEPGGGRATALLPFAGDSTSAATAINARGQVVGISGECDVAVGRRSATHAVLWDHGTVQDLGSLGGAFWHTPMAINDRGDVVGFSNPPDGNIDGDSLRAFLWTSAAGMKYLGRLEGDGLSEALDINNAGQIVGVSCGDVCHAVLWQNGVLYKLQDLIPGFADLLWSARSVNDSGQITGRVIELATGRARAYVATPAGVAP
ncbi:MAG TPA: hypothetical protein VJN39_04940 [Gemmatimonadales bacterium]|nr:hypothetical protein [Gemmatimonadales bacterium]